MVAASASASARAGGGSDWRSLVSARPGGLGDAGDRVAGGGAHAHGERDGLLAVEDQGRHGAAARTELVPAGRAAAGLDRVAEAAEVVDVAADRALGDAQPFGQLGAGELASGLQRGQQGEQALGGGHGHSLAGIRTEPVRFVRTVWSTARQIDTRDTTAHGAPDMTPFFDPHHIDHHDRPAMLRRRAEEHRLARQSPTRTPRRRRRGVRCACSARLDGNDAA